MLFMSFLLHISAVPFQRIKWLVIDVDLNRQKGILNNDAEGSMQRCSRKFKKFFLVFLLDVFEQVFHFPKHLIPIIFPCTQHKKQQNKAITVPCLCFIRHLPIYDYRFSLFYFLRPVKFDSNGSKLQTEQEKEKKSKKKIIERRAKL